MRNIALPQFCLQCREVVERNRAAIRHERGETFAEAVITIDG
ncbi:MAG TPA: hypothetical protein VH251_02805 [Verrucomicrobiae bacterium]|nr:hypothetical protein [Verrucomicrobiae bacterium]